MQPDSKQGWKAFGQWLGEALTAALQQSCTHPWRISTADEPFGPRPVDEPTVAFRFRSSGALEGEVFVLLKQAELPGLGLRSVPAQTFEEAHASGLLTLLEGCTSALEGALGQSGTVAVQVDQVENPELPDEHEMELWAQAEDQATPGARRVSFYLALDRKLANAAALSAARAFSYPSVGELTPAANLDLVLDVELNVTLRFGQRQLTLREILGLTSGSVVELDRQVDEPVDLVLDGRVVARGEAVIIDGNYGLRVTHVMQPQLPYA